MKEKYDIKGMSCAACEAHVTKACKKLNGVKDVNVNLLQNNMTIEYDDTLCNSNIIKDAVKKAGYEAILKGENKEKEKLSDKLKDNSLRDLIISIILLLVLMYFSMGHMMFNFKVPKVFDMKENPMGFSLIQFIILLPILYINRKYFINGFKSLFKAPNMDSLIAIGSFISTIYGIYCMFMISLGHTKYHEYLYFESAGMILVFVSIGKYLENLSKKKTTKALEDLYDLSPKEACVLRNDIEETINIEDVKINDIVIVRQGDLVPVDGNILEGSASINEANITGESIPVYKEKGDKVYSATIINSGYIKLEASKVGKDTTIETIISLVEEASNSKAPISKLADKISGIFVPTILIISLITFIVNFFIMKFTNIVEGNAFETALNFAITVVVIACPCALGLATPVAIMVGTGKGAKKGIIIRNAEILERAHLIKTVVMDKTGTITKGSPEVIDFINLDNDSDLINIIYSIENNSNHPLAKSIINYSEENNAKLKEVKDYTSLEGKGLKGSIEGITYYIGNLRLLKELNIEDSNTLTFFETSSKEGKTPLAIIKENKVIGYITVKDPIKDSAKDAISKLKEKGIDVIMLTGDNKNTALSIANEVGVTSVISDTLPVDKANVIKSLKKDDNNLVCMVGDGVNDAIALAEADLSIAIGSGADVAVESSDIILLNNNLMDVYNAIALSKCTIRHIKLGLFWAFFYNTICVILATGIFYYVSKGAFKMEPMYGAIAMSISSVSVVLNALLINLFKFEDLKEDKNKIAKDENNIIDMKEGEKMELYVKDMMCKNCERHVREALEELNASNINIDLDTKLVTFEGVSLDKAIDKIKEAGYTPTKD